MEDELDQGIGGVSESHLSDNLHNETLVENMGCGNQVDETYEERDDDEEIMVEIVGSDVFVDGVGGKEEGELGPTEIGDLEKKEEEMAKKSEAVDVSSTGVENKLAENELGLLELRDEKNHIVTEAMDVSIGRGQNRNGATELELPVSKDKENSVVTEATNVSGGGCENKMGEIELEFSELRDGNIPVVTEAMDVGSKYEKGESELGLPQTRDGENYFVTEPMDVSSDGGENKTRGSEDRLPVTSDKKNCVVPEAMDVSSEEVENKMGKSEAGLSKLIEEKNNVDTVENKVVESELKLPDSMDEKNSLDTDENEIGESELGLPESRDLTDNVIPGKYKIGEIELRLLESRDVTNNVFTGENKTGESDLGLHDLGDEVNNVVTSKNKTGEIDLMLPESSDENNNAVMAENKMREDELGFPKSKDEKNVVTQAIVSESRGEHNQAVTEEIDGSFSETVKVEAGFSSVQTEEVIVSTLVMNNEEEMIKDVAVDEKTGITDKEEEVLPLSDDASNQDRMGSKSMMSDGATKDLHDCLSENTQVYAIDSATLTTQTVICEEKMINDEAVDEKKEILPLTEDALNKDRSGSDSGETEDSHDGELGNGEEPKDAGVIGSVAEEVDLVNVAETEGLIVSDSNSTKCEKLDVVMDANNGESNINPLSLSCVGDDDSLKSNQDLETNMVEQNHVVSDKPTQPAEEFDADVVNKNESQQIVEEIESNQSLESQENAEIPNDVEKRCLPEIKEQGVSALLTETSDHVVGELESINLIPSDTASSDNTEKTEMPLGSVTFSLLDGGEVDEKNDSEINRHNAMEVNSELGKEEISPEAENLKLSYVKRVELGSSLKLNQSGYFLPPQNGADFAVSDLVWGKVRSHPWWPGQIFDPVDASEKAIKYHKKDSYLVAYFGDRTFAWNESSLLKPFGSHFSQIEKQSNSEVFQNAVDSALEEVSRRVELGLACSCVPRDKYAMIEAQIVENTGIREESSKRYGLDHSTQASAFEPDKLIQYVKDLAPCAFLGPDRLDLVIARAQLSAFCRFKNYRPPIEFPSPSELLEMDDEKITSDEIIIASHKRKHAPKDDAESRKERSMTELMGPAGGDYSLDAEDESFGKKRRALDPSVDGYDKRVSVYSAKLSNLTSQTSNKPSFKIGECIRRVASQLTRSASSGKDEMVVDGLQHPSERRGGMVLSIESFSVDEILLQLEQVAQEPKKRHDFPNVIHAFFMGFRSSVTLNRRGRKKRLEQVTAGGPAEGFEFDDDVGDSYWTDRIVQNYSEEQLLLNSRENGVGTFQMVPFFAEKTGKLGRKPNSRKRFSDSTAVNELDERVRRRKQESSPAELILSFAERNTIPSEINLNKMFRRFGPLMESETEVDHESGCAKVIFKRGSDAEVARSSSVAFNLFGPVLVNYQIGYEPLISVRVLPIALPMPREDVTLMQ